MQYLDNMVGLSVEKIESAISEHGFMSHKLCPFAFDEISNSMQCINTESGNVVNFDLDEKEVDEDQGMNYGKYLESIRDRILSKKLMFEEGLGLVKVQ